MFQLRLQYMTISQILTMTWISFNAALTIVVMQRPLDDICHRGSNSFLYRWISFVSYYCVLHS